MKTPSYIYAISAPNGLVKIGTAVNPEARLRSLRCGSPLALTLLGVKRGGRAAEKSFHDRFRKNRVSGEWFTLSPIIEAAISTWPTKPPLRKRNGLAATIRLPENQAKRLAKIVDRKRDPLAPSITQILLRGLELSLKEVERR